jgi:Phytanoyl-CoA dioxygenase (PhyH)
MQTVDQGYSITPHCLTKEECTKIAEALSGEDVLRSRAGARHLMANPVVAAVANRESLIGIAEEWLSSPVPFRATLFEKSFATNWLVPWHQDTALPLARRFQSRFWGPWSEKAGVLYAHAPAWALSRVVALRVHLDDSGAENGPLRVIPKSHALGVLTDEEVLHHVSTHEAVACLAPRGGVIAMRPLLIHCSSKAHSPEPRRVLHIEYADSLMLGADIRLAVA